MKLVMETRKVPPRVDSPRETTHGSEDCGGGNTILRRSPERENASAGNSNNASQNQSKQSGGRINRYRRRSSGEAEDSTKTNPYSKEASQPPERGAAATMPLVKTEPKSPGDDDGAVCSDRHEPSQMTPRMWLLFAGVVWVGGFAFLACVS